jgi:hypothetical protein
MNTPASVKAQMDKAFTILCVKEKSRPQAPAKENDPLADQPSFL